MRSHKMVSVLYSFVYFLFFLMVCAMAPYSPKFRRLLVSRRGLCARIRKWKQTLVSAPDTLYWFHVSSSGEFEQCLPIMDAIRASTPTLPIFLSYFSPSAEKAVRFELDRRKAAGLAPGWDHSDYSPFDFSIHVRSYLNALRPSHFICIHREIWPGILLECKRRNIPRYLFATYFPKERHFFWLRRWLEQYDFIGTTTVETTELLKSILSKPVIHTLGDPRVDRVMTRKRMSVTGSWEHYFSEQNVLVLASLWNEDFEEIREALETWQYEAPRWRLALIPHEPCSQFVKKLLKWGEQTGLRFRLWSSWVKNPDTSSHLVVDCVGQLAELYRVASIVFVGGSFRARVHNVLEPAAYQKAIVTGPFIQNSLEAIEMHSKGMLIRTLNGQDFLSNLRTLSSDTANLQEQSLKAASFLAERSGASIRYADIIRYGLPL
ncbi:MAG: hypothetical protein HY537_10705 [Deltaproteobacteria bacterium]|nr:hypothetical protein [Deltaproteobacteria bacterium]